MDIVREELAADPTIDITTTGRRSGEPRRIEIWMFDLDGRFFIAGTPGPRAWLANLIAHPAFTVHLKRNAHRDLPARATVVTDLGIRRRVADERRRVGGEWVANQNDDDFVAHAPMVEVTFESSASG
ncbi:MAG TPA: nitroreductase family deazaflavin-dependent oxidoreductase [Acidimicrobiia bacterium]